MPHYDYQCTTCGHVFEVFQSMNDPKKTDCIQSDCSGSVKRLLGTGAGIVFKGSGFYETDFKDKPKPHTQKEPSSAPSKDSEAKPSNASKPSVTPSDSSN